MRLRLEVVRYLCFKRLPVLDRGGVRLVNIEAFYEVLRMKYNL